MGAKARAQSSSNAFERCSCPRTTFATVSPASTGWTWPTPPARCCSTSPIVAGQPRWLAPPASIPVCLPPLFESPDVCARISESGAAATGLLKGTPVVAGAGDQAAGAVGLGIVSPGAVHATIGTSGVVFARTDRPALDPKGRLHTFCHAIPSRWHVMGVTQSAGLSLRWFRDNFGTGSRRLPRSV